MNFTIARENLQQGLAAVGAVVPTRTTLPVLYNVLLRVDEDGVELSASDQDVSVRLRVPAQVEQSGEITVPAKKLAEIARELPNAPVSLSLSGDQLKIKCARSNFKVNGLPADEFPRFPVVDFEQGATITGKTLHDLIAQTSFAASTEETRPILNGVLWHVKQGEQGSEMRMVATNGHRLAVRTVFTDGIALGDMILYPKALHQVQKLFGADDEVQIAKSANYAGFRKDGVEVYTRLIEGPYPNYEQIIPKDNNRVAIVDREALVSSLRRMAIVARDQKAQRVVFEFGHDELTFDVRSPDAGEADEDLPISFEGDPIKIGFNVNYVLEILKFIPTEKVKISLKESLRPAIVQPFGEGDIAENEYKVIVMPVRIED